MAASRFTTSALEELCSGEYLELLNLSDTLSHIEGSISAPTIVVCGIQSSGKSSVLKNLTGIPFDIKNVNIRASIEPNHPFTAKERALSKQFLKCLDPVEGLSDFIREVKLRHGETLRIEIFGPDLPNLTVVDLPGIEPSNREDSLLPNYDYKFRPKNIILTVIDAGDHGDSEATLKLAREAREIGCQFIEVITKLDDLGFDHMRLSSFITRTRDRKAHGRLAWHVLDNLEPDVLPSILRDRYSNEAWEMISPSDMGAKSLRDKIRKVLINRAVTHLPRASLEIQDSINFYREKKRNLLRTPSNKSEARSSLLQVSQSLQMLVKAACDGFYHGPFFEVTDPGISRQRRVRATVYSLSQKFSTTMTRNGHYRSILEDHVGTVCLSEHQVQVTREEFLEHTENLVGMSRGEGVCETFIPSVINDLFFEQSAPWKVIVKQYITEAWEAASTFLRLAIVHHNNDKAAIVPLMNDEAVEVIFQEIFEPALHRVRRNMNCKANELLKLHRTNYPMTHDSQYLEVYREINNDRRRHNYIAVIKDYFNAKSDNQSRVEMQSRDIDALADSLVKNIDNTTSRSMAINALDCMTSHYKIALRRFIEQINVNIIEGELISVLHQILTPLEVFKLPDETVARIAIKFDKHKAEEHQVDRQLDTLEEKLAKCKKFLPKDALVNGNGHQGDDKSPEEEIRASEDLESADSESEDEPQRQVFPNNVERRANGHE